MGLLAPASSVLILANVPVSTSELVPDPDTVPPVGATPVSVPLPNGTLNVTVNTSAPALPSAMLRPASAKFTSSAVEKACSVLTGGKFAVSLTVAMGELVVTAPFVALKVMLRSVVAGVGKLLL